MKNQSFNFIKRKQSRGGKEATGLGIASIALLIAAAVVSWVMEGKAGVYVGGMAIIGTLLAVFGFVTGMKSFREKDVSLTLSVAGTIACGLVFVVWMTMFVAGIR